MSRCIAWRLSTAWQAGPFAEVGIVLKRAVVETKLPLGEVVEKGRSTSVGQVPLSVTTAEEARLLTLLKYTLLIRLPRVPEDHPC